MACFLVPGGEAIATSIVQKAVGKEKARRWRLGWLNKILWGGTLLLMVEHVWHGEVVPWPPFLTAMSNPSDVPAMLHEMATIGTAMAVVATLCWVLLVVFAQAAVKKSVRPKEAEA